MKYKVLRTDKAEEQLRDIIISYLDKLEKSIMNLEDFPYSGAKSRYSILRK